MLRWNDMENIGCSVPGTQYLVLFSGNWQLATGNWQLATGNRAVSTACMI